MFLWAIECLPACSVAEGLCFTQQDSKITLQCTENCAKTSAAFLVQLWLHLGLCPMAVSRRNPPPPAHPAEPGLQEPVDQTRIERHTFIFDSWVNYLMNKSPSTKI